MHSYPSRWKWCSAIQKVSYPVRSSSRASDARLLEDRHQVLVRIGAAVDGVAAIADVLHVHVAGDRLSNLVIMRSPFVMGSGRPAPRRRRRHPDYRASGGAPRAGGRAGGRCYDWARFRGRAGHQPLIGKEAHVLFTCPGNAARGGDGAAKGRRKHV